MRCISCCLKLQSPIKMRIPFDIWTVIVPFLSASDLENLHKVVRFSSSGFEKLDYIRLKNLEQQFSSISGSDFHEILLHVSQNKDFISQLLSHHNVTDPAIKNYFYSLFSFQFEHKITSTYITEILKNSTLQNATHSNNVFDKINNGFRLGYHSYFQVIKPEKAEKYRFGGLLK